MSSAVLLAPRVYFRMAEDGLFFKQFAYITKRTKVPMVAIAAHGSIAAVYAATGSYERILNWISAWICFFFAALCHRNLYLSKARRGKSATGICHTFSPVVDDPLYCCNSRDLYRKLRTVSARHVTRSPVMVAGIIFYYVWKAVHARTTSLAERDYAKPATLVTS